MKKSKQTISDYTIPKRETFTSGIAIFFAALGSAVGLGNIWKFPYLVGANGGGAFLLIYLLSTFLVGVPILISEYFIGRRSRKNAIGAIDVLKAKPFWKSMGYMGLINSFLMMFYYSAVAGWVYSYIFKSITGFFSPLKSLNLTDATSIVASEFNNTVKGHMWPMFWQLVVLITVGTIIVLGVKKGIEKVTKTLMPILFILIILIAIKSLTLDGASKGVKFLFKVDFSVVTPSVILSAVGLAFFKLSIGTGAMLTYGSYFTSDNNIPSTSIKIALSDVAISLLAGLATFPVVFTFGLKPGAGPGLLFNTIPLVFSRIPLGNVLLVLFFILTGIAATCAMTSIIEFPVAFLVEQKGFSRKKAVLIIISLISIVGVLTVHPKSLLGNIKILGLNFFDVFDKLSSNILMPIGGLLITIFVGYFIKNDDLKDELSNNGTLNNALFLKVYRFILRYITPFLLFIVFLNCIGIL